MAESNGAGCLAVEDDEDCDVIFEGSPLHQHLQRMGLTDETESRNVEKQKSGSSSSSGLVEKRRHKSKLTSMQDFNHRGKITFFALVRRRS